MRCLIRILQINSCTLAGLKEAPAFFKQERAAELARFPSKSLQACTHTSARESCPELRAEAMAAGSPCPSEPPCQSEYFAVTTGMS